MKKLLAIFAFLAITLSVSAQEKKVNFQAIAKEKTHFATKHFSLDGDKQRAVYNAYMMSERKLAALSNPNAKSSTEAVEKINTELYAKLETILTAEQVNKLKALEAEKSKMKK